MNKNDLVAAVSDSSGLSKADSAKAVDAVFDSITGSLSGAKCVWLALARSALLIVKQPPDATRAPEKPFRSRLPNNPSSKPAKGLRNL